MSGHGEGWTEDLVEVVSALWLEGVSALQIAMRVGRGLTRNAIIGKMNRLKAAGMLDRRDAVVDLPPLPACDPVETQPAAPPQPPVAEPAPVRAPAPAPPPRPAPPPKPSTPPPRPAVNKTPPPAPPPPKPPAPKTVTLPIPAPKPAPAASAKPNDDPAKGVPYLEASDAQCKLLLGDPSDLICCGLPVRRGTSWCEGHAQRVFNGSPTKRKQRPNERKFLAR